MWRLRSPPVTVRDDPGCADGLRRRMSSYLHDGVVDALILLLEVGLGCVEREPSPVVDDDAPLLRHPTAERGCHAPRAALLRLSGGGEQQRPERLEVRRAVDGD